MIVDQKENKSSYDYRVTMLDTIDPMIAELLKETKKHTQDINEMKTMLKRLSN